MSRPVEIPYREIHGLVSAWALDQHHKLYLGYLDRLTAAIGGEAAAAITWPTRHDGYLPAWAQAHQADPAALGGVLLHELYFAGLSPRASVPDVRGRAAGWLASCWGCDIGRWEDEMGAVALQARGWAVTAASPTGTMKIFALDSQDIRPLGSWHPIIAIDLVQIRRTTCGSCSTTSRSALSTDLR